jgi:excisionase family DNA binding protein
MIPRCREITTGNARSPQEQKMARFSVGRRYLSVAQAAEYSGLAEVTIRRLVRSGRLQGRRPGARRVLIDRLDIDRLMGASPRTHDEEGIDVE